MYVIFGCIMPLLLDLVWACAILTPAPLCFQLVFWCCIVVLTLVLASCVLNYLLALLHSCASVFWSTILHFAPFSLRVRFSRPPCRGRVGPPCGVSSLSQLPTLLHQEPAYVFHFHHLVACSSSFYASS